MKITKTTDSISVYHQNGHNISVASIDRIEPNKWWISRVNVKEIDRNKGIGSAMLKMAIEAVLEQEEVEIVVAPGGYNEDYNKQINFYKKNGFVETEENGLLVYKQ